MPKDSINQNIEFDELQIKEAIDFLYINFDFFIENIKKTVLFKDLFYNQPLRTETFYLVTHQNPNQKNQHETLLHWLALLKQHPDFALNLLKISKNNSYLNIIESSYQKLPQENRKRNTRRENVERGFSYLLIDEGFKYVITPKKLSESQNKFIIEEYDSFCNYIGRENPEIGFRDLKKDAMGRPSLSILGEFFFHITKFKNDRYSEESIQEFIGFLNNKLKEKASFLKKFYEQSFTCMGHETVTNSILSQDAFTTRSELRQISVDFKNNQYYINQTFRYTFYYPDQQAYIKLPGTFKLVHKITEESLQLIYVATNTSVLFNCFMKEHIDYIEKISNRTSKATEDLLNKTDELVATNEKNGILTILKIIEDDHDAQLAMKLKALGDCFTKIYRPTKYPFFSRGGITWKDVKKIGLLKEACRHIIREGIANGTLDKTCLEELINPKEPTNICLLIDFQRKYATDKTHTRKTIENILNPEKLAAELEAQIAEQTFTLGMV